MELSSNQLPAVCLARPTRPISPSLAVSLLVNLSRRNNSRQQVPLEHVRRRVPLAVLEPTTVHREATVAFHSVSGDSG